MKNELITFEMVKEVTGIARELVANSLCLGIVCKGQKQKLIGRINSFLSMEKAEAIHMLVQKNIQNIGATLELIDRMNLKGPALVYAMRELDKEAAALEDILEDFKKSFKGNI